MIVRQCVDFTDGISLILYFFEENLKVTVQQIGVSHNGLFERQDDLSSVAYWYQSEPHQKFKELLPVEKRWPR